jgi:UDP-N-acetylglucosamine--N-acetylmuramyl-(pentapeptide) pyrophosphoryl-undecaprenol N-acetylglucosamine transferase
MDYDRKVSKKICLSGGGTVGHISPLLALAQKLKAQDPTTKILYIGERKGKFKQLIEKSEHIDNSFYVFSGKYRRYYGRSFWQSLKDFQTILLNIRDFFYVVIGFFQALFVLLRHKPTSAFLKGGYVVVPVGLASALLRVPFVTHDSDSTPGLANKIVARWAKINAVASPTAKYPYPKNKLRAIGVIIDSNYSLVDGLRKSHYRSELGIASFDKVLLITGGSQGARAINQAFAKVVPQYIEMMRDLYVIHITGKNDIGIYGDYTNDRLRVVEFIEAFYKYTGSADLIVTRAGANSMAEFGAQGKACLVVPNPYLADNHQAKNAKDLQENDAVVVVEEDTLEDFLKPEEGSGLHELLKKDFELKRLGNALHSITKLDALSEAVNLIIEIDKTT